MYATHAMFNNTPYTRWKKCNLQCDSLPAAIQINASQVCGITKKNRGQPKSSIYILQNQIGNPCRPLRGCNRGGTKNGPCPREMQQDQRNWERPNVPGRDGTSETTSKSPHGMTQRLRPPSRTLFVVRIQIATGNLNCLVSISIFALAKIWQTRFLLTCKL